MNTEKPGIFKRLFSWTGKLFVGLRWLINLVFLFVFIAVLVNLFSKDVRPLPDKAPLRLVVSGTLVEQRTYTDPLTQILEQSAQHDAETPIRDLIETVDRARNDPRITGLLLDLTHLRGGGLAKLAEVGESIAEFRDSGKPVIAFSDDFTQAQYFLASYADEIVVNPMGGVMFTGFGYYGTYFREAAEKLKVNFHVFKVGRFKSAVEPFTRNTMSDEARENTRDWVEPLWNQYTRTVENNRNLPSGTIAEMANDLPRLLNDHQGDLASLALDKRLVDRILPRTALRDMLVERFGKSDHGEEGYVNIPHKEYLRHVNLPLVDKAGGGNRNVGLIVASGSILEGHQMEGTIGGESLSALIQKAREDKSLKALVIRVDSPGGSAFASDVIRREILETQKKMPVVISMGSLAASGGYWISASADEIWAQPATLTGSIGVFGILPTFEDSLDSLGIHSDGVGTADLADFQALDRPLGEKAGQVIQLNVENIYRQFINLVAEGRGIPPAEVESIAEGRIWTGRQAREAGLVDQLGGLDDAIASAAKRAGLESWSVKPVKRPLSFQEQLLKQMAEGSAQIRALLFDMEALHSPLSGLALLLRNHLEDLARLNDPRGLYLQCFGCPEV